MKKILFVAMVMVLIINIGCVFAEDTLDYKNYKWEVVTSDYSHDQEILFMRGVFTNNSNEDLPGGLEISIVLYDELGKPVGAGNTYKVSVRSHTSKYDMVCVHIKKDVKWVSMKIFMNPM